MPTYDYECTSCGHRFELFEKVSEPAPRPCPKCRKGKAKRLPGHGAGFIFKGAGFYSTDYKGSSAASDHKKKTTRREKKSDKKSESKPESKSESKE